MAINPENLRDIRDRADDLFEEVEKYIDLGEQNKEFIREKVFGVALEEIEDLIEKNRSPRMLVFGRSGSGKSSLINAMAQKEIAEVGEVAPETVESDSYHIQFEDRYASWDIIDTRGLFESVSADEGPPQDTVDLLKQDMEILDPDVLLHVMTPEDLRAGEQDFGMVQSLMDELDRELPPIILVLTHVDTKKDLDDSFPPETSPSWSGSIKQLIDFASDVIELDSYEPIDENNQPLFGYHLKEMKAEDITERYVGVVPVYTKELDTLWNIESLLLLLADVLPLEALLDFFQGQNRDTILKRFVDRYINRFTGIASGIGGAPTPVADIAVLTPLQFLLIILIGGISCQPFSVETGKDYLAAGGVTLGAGFAAREFARSITQFVPVGGQALSATIAGGTTFAIGKSAKNYFFEGEYKSPAEWWSEAKNVVTELNN